MNKKLLFLSLLSTLCFAFPAHGRYHQHRQWPVVSAKDARDVIMETIYEKHKEAIDWWIEFINAKVLIESRRPNASVGVDISNASFDVQEYLALAYERAGYRSELIPGWTGEDEHHHGGHPNGQTFLGLSW